MSVTIPIVATEDVLGGKPRVEGTRLAVDQLGTLVREQGWTRERVLGAFELTSDELDAALDYYDAHPDEMAGYRADREQLDAELREQSRAPE